VAVIHHDRFSAHRCGAGTGDASIARAVDRGSDGNGDVHAFVELFGLQYWVGSVAEAAGDASVEVDGPRQLQSGGQCEHVANFGLCPAGVGFGQEACIRLEAMGTGDARRFGSADGSVPNLASEHPQLQGSLRTPLVQLLELTKGVSAELTGDRHLESRSPLSLR